MTAKRILRVFPDRTSYTPDDDMVCVGFPGLFIPLHDEVHISCVFTWDMDFCETLKDYDKAGNPKYSLQTKTPR